MKYVIKATNEKGLTYTVQSGKTDKALTLIKELIEVHDNVTEINIKIEK